MNITETCLSFLQKREWLKLNELLSDDKNCKELASSPTFKLFEDHFVNEIKRYEDDGNKDTLLVVVTRIFDLSQKTKILKLSEPCVLGIAEYLFEKYPTERYAKMLPENEKAREFLKRKDKERKSEIEKNTLTHNLQIEIGASGSSDFSKPIFNSPQEKELYLAARKVLKDELILPNIALSSIIDSKVVELLEPKTESFFYKSTLDLCIVDSKTFMPIFFIELDSSWHDQPKQVEKDRMKDEIFEKAGMALHRLRKKENKNMEEVFELYIKANYLQ